jgi:hypothetical protein
VVAREALPIEANLSPTAGNGLLIRCFNLAGISYAIRRRARVRRLARAARTVADALTRPEEVRPSAGVFVACCAAHDDRHPSLSIREAENREARLANERRPVEIAKPYGAGDFKDLNEGQVRLIIGEGEIGK